MEVMVAGSGPKWHAPPCSESAAQKKSFRPQRRELQRRLYFRSRVMFPRYRTRTRTNTNPNGTEASAAGRSGNARALRKQSKCLVIQGGEEHWPNSSENLQKARYLWVFRTPQNNKEEGARAKKLVTCGTQGPLGRGRSVPFSAQGAYCSAPEPYEAITRAL